MGIVSGTWVWELNFRAPLGLQSAFWACSKRCVGLVSAGQRTKEPRTQEYIYIYIYISAGPSAFGSRVTGCEGMKVSLKLTRVRRAQAMARRAAMAREAARRAAGESPCFLGPAGQLRAAMWRRADRRLARRLARAPTEAATDAEAKASAAAAVAAAAASGGHVDGPAAVAAAEVAAWSFVDSLPILSRRPSSPDEEAQGQVSLDSP